MKSNDSIRSNTEVLHKNVIMKICATAISILLLFIDLTGILLRTKAFYGLVPDEEFKWPEEHILMLHVKGFILALCTPFIIIVGMLVHSNNVRTFWCGNFTSGNVILEARWWTRVSFATDV